MPVAELDGIEIAYELVGEGQPWVLTPGRTVHEGSRRAARDGAGVGRPRQAGPHLGPSELRRVVGGVPRRVGVGGAGRRARRAPSSSRSRPDRDRRRLGRRPGLAARRGSQPRRHRRAGDVVDQRRRAGTAPVGQLLLHAVGRCRVARRDGSRRRARPVAGGAGAQPAKPGALPRDGSPGVHRR